MQVKLIEIRDRLTFIAAWAFKTDPVEHAQAYLLRRCGWGRDGVILGRLDSGAGQADPYSWNCRTMTAAHAWVCEHFDEIENGAGLLFLGNTVERVRSAMGPRSHAGHDSPCRPNTRSPMSRAPCRGAPKRRLPLVFGITRKLYVEDEIATQATDTIIAAAESGEDAGE